MKKRDEKNKPPTLKRRKNKQKAKRLAHTQLMNEISTTARKLRADASLVAVRRVMQGDVIIGVRKGLFGHPNPVMLRLDDASIAGCAEDKTELAKFVNNMGLLVVSQMFNHNLAEGIEKLGESIARWAGIDLEALRKAAAEEAAATVETVDEDGDIVVTTVEASAVDTAPNEIVTP